MKKAILVSAILAGAFLAVGCGAQDEAGNITLVGSTSVSPLMEIVAEKYTDSVLDIQSVGSSAGIKAAAEGTAMVGMSSRELKDDEKSGLEEVVIALDGIAITVHPNNSVKDITKEQVLKVYKGEITNWKELGGKDAPIVVVSREEGSGTRGAFEELVGLEDEAGSLLTKDAVIADGNGAVKQNVATKENAIGYLSLGAVDNTVKSIKVDGVDATEANIKNGSYKISRPFILVTKGKPSEGVQKLLDYILSAEGQKIVTEEGYITIK